MADSRGQAAARRRAEQAGRRAESLAAWWLRLAGYRVVARRHRTPVGEIDIVAIAGRRLVFVEVKQRADGADGLAAVGPASRRRLMRAAQYFLAGPERARLPPVEAIRFDVVVVRPWRRPLHLRNAWMAGMDGTPDAGW